MCEITIGSDSILTAPGLTVTDTPYLCASHLTIELTADLSSECICHFPSVLDVILGRSPMATVNMASRLELVKNLIEKKKDKKKIKNKKRWDRKD